MSQLDPDLRLLLNVLDSSYQLVQPQGLASLLAAADMFELLAVLVAALDNSVVWGGGRREGEGEKCEER